MWYSIIVSISPSGAVTVISQDRISPACQCVLTSAGLIFCGLFLQGNEKNNCLARNGITRIQINLSFLCEEEWS